MIKVFSIVFLFFSFSNQIHANTITTPTGDDGLPLNGGAVDEAAKPFEISGLELVYEPLNDGSGNCRVKGTMTVKKCPAKKRDKVKTANAGGYIPVVGGSASDPQGSSYGGAGSVGMDPDNVYYRPDPLPVIANDAN